MPKSPRRPKSRTLLPAPAAASSVQTLTIPFVINAIRHWWKVCLPIAILLATGVGIGVYFVFDPVYEARVSVRIEDDSALGIRQRNEMAKSQLGMVRHEVVLDSLFQDPEIAQMDDFKGEVDKVRRLQANLAVVSSNMGNIYYMSFRSPSPKNAAKVINKVAESYFLVVDRMQDSRLRQLLNVVEDERLASEQEIQQRREKLKQLCQERTGQDPFATKESEDVAELGQGRQMHQWLYDLGHSIDERKVELEVLSKQLAGHDFVAPEELLEKAVLESQQVTQLRSLVSAMQSQYEATVRTSARAKNEPGAQKQLTDLLKKQDELARLQQTVRANAKQQIEREMAERTNRTIHRYELALEVDEQKRSNLKHDLEEELKKVKRFPGENAEMYFARLDLEQANKRRNDVVKQKLDLQLAQKFPDRVTLMRTADVPVVPVEKIPWTKILVASGAVAFVPFLLALVWELTIRRVTDTDQLEKNALKVVGEVATFPASTNYRKASNSRRLARKLRLFEESVDSLRTCLLLSKPIQQARSIAVMSSSSAEGKTTIASQLAISIARSTGGRTLLIDGDMRSPDVHEIFQIAPEPGLAKVLDGQVTLAEAIVSWHDGVDILPAGRLHVNPHKLVGRDGLRKLIDEAAKTYDHIVIDTPPVLAAGESLVMAQVADAAIMCVMKDKSRSDQVRKTYERLQNAGVNLAGCVMNGVSSRRYAYHYGDYGYDYAYHYE